MIRHLLHSCDELVSCMYICDRYLNGWNSVYQWLSARLQYLQCVSNGNTAVLHKTIDMFVSCSLQCTRRMLLLWYWYGVSRSLSNDYCIAQTRLLDHHDTGILCGLSRTQHILIDFSSNPITSLQITLYQKLIRPRNSHVALGSLATHNR